MSERISSEQRYINQLMSSLPEVKQKKEYSIKEGESLWKLAKRELGSKKASNKEIQEYVFLIAKLNGLTTIEKMNSLRPNDKIYIPENVKPATNQVKATKPEAEKSSLEKSVENIINILKTDKSAEVKRANVGYKKQYFHIFRDKKYSEGFISKNSPVLSFKLDDNEQIENLSLDDINDILKIKYDYDMDKNGKTILRKYPFRTVGQLGKEEKETLFNEIKRLYEEYKKNPKVYY